MTQIRKAVEADAARIGELLYQVHDVHAQARPDIFVSGKRKYQEKEIVALINHPDKPVYVYEDKNGTVQAYAFCEYQFTPEAESLVKRKVLFIDDLCVDGSQRGKKIGEKLYQFLVETAKAAQCHSVTLYVWNENEGALRFYQRIGLEPLKTLMEQRL